MSTRPCLCCWVETKTSFPSRLTCPRCCAAGCTQIVTRCETRHVVSGHLLAHPIDEPCQRCLRAPASEPQVLQPLRA